MIDFISSDPSADPQTVACAHLLAAVIAQAIEDAAGVGQVTSAETLSAVDWLFSKTSTFEDYARLIGADAGQIRTALLEPASKVEPKNSRFDASRRRKLRVAYVSWLTRRAAEEEALKKMKEKAT
jgi:hypothetical protein